MSFAMWNATPKAAREQREQMRRAGTTPEAAVGWTDLQPKPEKNPRFNPMRLGEVFNEPDPTPLITGMVMEGENICFVGPPKSGKSFLAIDIGMSIAFGQSVVGMHEVKKFGAVVYLSGEGHRGMKRRLKAWCQERGISPAQVEKAVFFYNKGVPSAAAGMDECKAFVDAIRATVGEPVLVVIDTMSRSLGTLNENEASTAAQYLDLTEGLRDGLKCTTLTIAHATNKGTNKIVHDIRGSSGFSAGFDAVWITIKNEQTGIVELRTLWLKDADELGPFFFKLKKVTVDGMENGAGAVLEYVSPGEARGAERQEGMALCALVYNKLKELGIDRPLKGLTDDEFAERWHWPPPRGYVGGLGAQELKAHAASLPEDEAIQLEAWCTEVGKTKKMLQNGATGRTRNGKSYPPRMAGLFAERTKPGEKPTRRWFISGYDPTRIDDG
jgi:hypothetical protein